MRKFLIYRSESQWESNYFLTENLKLNCAAEYVYWLLFIVSTALFCVSVRFLRWEWFI